MNIEIFFLIFKRHFIDLNEQKEDFKYIIGEKSYKYKCDSVYAMHRLMVNTIPDRWITLKHKGKAFYKL